MDEALGVGGICVGEKGGAGLLEHQAPGRSGRRPARRGRCRCGDAPRCTRGRRSGRRRGHPRASRTGWGRLAARPCPWPGSARTAGSRTAWRRADLRVGLLLPLSMPGRPGQHGQLARRRPRPASPERWAQLAGWTVILQERLDGTLWVSHDGLCVQVRPAPADVGQLPARKLKPPSDSDLPAELKGLIDADKSPAPEPPCGVIH